MPRPYTYACLSCKLVLADGPQYTWCPRCSGAVEWIDGRAHSWVCSPCGVVIDGRAEAAACPRCARELELLSPPFATDRPVTQLPRFAGKLVVAIAVLQAVFAVLDPEGFPYLASLLGLLQVMVVGLGIVLVLASRELRAIVVSSNTRIIHGLEHATANVLDERGHPVSSGHTYAGCFVLDLEHRGSAWERLSANVRAAAEDAITRIRFGERALAYSVRCGTSLLVAWVLRVFAVATAGVLALALAMPSGYAFALTVALGVVSGLLQRRAGLLAQRLLTVSTDFSSAIVVDVRQHVAPTGDLVHVTVSVDVIPRARGVAAIPV
ncbi:MAG: DUF6391 domain-containing protein [Kofleriaceae bacterium]